MNFKGVLPCCIMLNCAVRYYLGGHQACLGLKTYDERFLFLTTEGRKAPPICRTTLHCCNKLRRRAA
jgi:hypothetical protein